MNTLCLNGCKSIHIFAWSFTYESDEDIFARMRKGNNDAWQRKSMDFESLKEKQKIELMDSVKLQENQQGELINSAEEEQQIRDVFMLQQYLSKTGQKVFIGKSAVCEVYEYKEDKIENLYYYMRTVVKKYDNGVEKTDEKIFELPIKGIELHLYHKYQVGILFLEIVNYDFLNIEDIQLLNDFGRRLELPYIPSDTEQSILCAEQLGIKKRIGNMVKTNIVDFRDSIRKGQYSLNAAEFIYDILRGDMFSENSAGWGIKRIVKGHEDERMFLYSLITDEELSRKISNLDLSGEITDEKLSDEKNSESQSKGILRIISDFMRADAKPEQKEHKSESKEDIIKKIYALIHADAGSASCQDKKMLLQIFEKELYTRWREYGTLYGVSNYSFVCITGKPEYVIDSVIRPFVTEYIYMLSLVLAQCIEIQAMSEKTSHEERWNGTSLREIKKNYSEFKNQLLIQEFSNQEQGMDLYLKLQEQLYIDKYHDILDEQLENIYEVVSIRTAEKIQRLGFFISILTAGVTILEHVGACLAENVTVGLLTNGIAILLSVIIFALSIAIYWKK